MKEYKNIKIIGVDHGYGNIKTAHCCFPSGVISGDKEPTFRDKLLIYNGRYYQIGVGHKEFRLSTRAAPDGFEYRKAFPNREGWKVYEGTLDNFKQDAESRVAQEQGWFDLYDIIQDTRCRVTQAKGLPQGWLWHSWSDCSGHLESPDGKCYFSYSPAMICCCYVIEYEFLAGSGNWDFEFDLRSETDFKRFAEQKMRQQLEQQEGENWQMTL